MRGCLADVAVVRFSSLGELPLPTLKFHPQVMLNFKENKVSKS